jgi:putative ABC transport system substrate-binding protein
VIGFVNSSNVSLSSATDMVNPFREGLKESGYIEGRDVSIEYRWAAGRVERLPELLDDLISRKVALIVASGGFVSAMTAKAATRTIPILFIAGYDPVSMGLVASMNRPGGNATGVSVYTIELVQKRFEFLLSILPSIRTIALLVNPNPYGSELEAASMAKATSALGKRLLILQANVESDIDEIFASAIQKGADALIVSADPFFTARAAKIVELAARHKLPAIYPWRNYVVAGGLMSFGPTLTWAYNKLGNYAARILKGAKPGELPVEQPSIFHVVVNNKTLAALGITLRRDVLVDEYID